MNGDFENGLTGWRIFGTPPAPRVTQQVVHSGKWSCYITGPTNTASGFTNGVQQDNIVFPVPAEFTAWFYVDRMPQFPQCGHPYNQFTLYDTLGKALEFGVFQSNPSAAIETFFFYQGAGTFFGSLQRGAWNKYTVRLWPDHADLLINDQWAATFDQSVNFKWVQVSTVQILSSCTGAWYVDDLTLNSMSPLPPPPPVGKTITLTLSPDQVASLLKQLS